MHADEPRPHHSPTTRDRYEESADDPVDRLAAVDAAILATAFAAYCTPSTHTIPLASLGATLRRAGVPGVDSLRPDTLSTELTGGVALTYAEVAAIADKLRRIDAAPTTADGHTRDETGPSQRPSSQQASKPAGGASRVGPVRLTCNRVGGPSEPSHYSEPSRRLTSVSGPFGLGQPESDEEDGRAAALSLGWWPSPHVLSACIRPPSIYR